MQIISSGFYGGDVKKTTVKLTADDIKLYAKLHRIAIGKGKNTESLAENEIDQARFSIENWVMKKLSITDGVAKLVVETRADLSKIDLSYGNFDDVVFTLLKLNYSNLTYTNMTNTALFYANINMVNFTGSDFTRAQIQESLNMSGTILIDVKGISEVNLAKHKEKGAITTKEELFALAYNNASFESYLSKYFKITSIAGNQEKPAAEDIKKFFCSDTLELLEFFKASAKPLRKPYLAPAMQEIAYAFHDHKDGTKSILTELPKEIQFIIANHLIDSHTKDIVFSDAEKNRITQYVKTEMHILNEGETKEERIAPNKSAIEKILKGRPRKAVDYVADVEKPRTV
ncbi:MAG: hypothetical protein K0R98_661 [Rickettsiaceae bacterium]|jgi:hypothetical protein|nr:hypothetical protein [Rickettsiaceae bacterium]